MPSDWLPTFLSLANSSHLVEGLGLDGVDQTEAFRTGDQVGICLYQCPKLCYLFNVTT